MLTSIQLHHSPPALPETSTRDAEEPSSADQKQKRSRVSQACDVCRKYRTLILAVFSLAKSVVTLFLSPCLAGKNHRKCPGPAKASNSCERCIKQHKSCTWNEHKIPTDRPQSASVSPTPKKPPRTTFKRSPSIQTNHHPLAELSPTRSDERSGSRSWSEPSDPRTPPDSLQNLQLTTFKHTVFQGEQFAQPEGCEESCPESEKKLPQFYADCLAVANKHDLLLYALPLRVWGEQHQAGTHDSTAELRCITPSWVEPQPTQRESLVILHALMNGSGTSSAGAVSVPASGNRAETSSDDRTHPQFVSNNTYAGGPGQVAQPPMVTDRNDIVTNEAWSEDEPDLFLEPETHFEAQSPYRHHTGREQFNSVLYTSCHCYATPPSNPPSSVVEENSNSFECTEKDWSTFWDECMSDAFQTASQSTVLDATLRFMPV